MKKAIILFCFLTLAFTMAFAEGKRPLKIDDYFALKDLSDVHISPDGKWAAYVVSSTDEAKDESSTYIYTAPLAGVIRCKSRSAERMSSLSGVQTTSTLLFCPPGAKTIRSIC